MIPVGRLAEMAADGQFRCDAQGRPTSALLVVDADAPASDQDIERATRRLAVSRAIIVAAGTALPDPRIRRVADLCIVGPGAAALSAEAVVAYDVHQEVRRLHAAVTHHPVAALTMTWLLRGSTRLPVADALVMESAAYSMLLAGSDFQRWLAQRGDRREADSRDRVRLSRSEDTLVITLARPARRNAMDALMRDALIEALSVAEHDPCLRVELRADGPAFSAGGDLDEFGTASDVSTAHVVRLAASVGAVLDRIAERVTARVHGPCIGAGVELPAFAGRVIAAPGTEFALPEIAMGLIPGAGGTVSLPRRIGRQRTLWLALTGARLPAETALEWGLVDAVE